MFANEGETYHIEPAKNHATLLQNHPKFKSMNLDGAHLLYRVQDMKLPGINCPVHGQSHNDEHLHSNQHDGHQHEQEHEQEHESSNAFKSTLNKFLSKSGIRTKQVDINRRVDNDNRNNNNKDDEHDSNPNGRQLLQVLPYYVELLIVNDARRYASYGANTESSAANNVNSLNFIY